MAQTSRNESFWLVLLTAATISPPVVVILCLSYKLIVSNENLQRKKKECTPRAQTS